MISDQRNDTSNGNVETLDRGLTIEESFFLELLQKKEKAVISLKYTPKGPKVGNLEPFSNYYSEEEIIRLLESLVSKKALVKQEKGSVLLCPKCGGHATMSVLVCPRCGSTKVGRKEDLNHAECEYWGSRDEFIDGVLLRCPRCDELLDERAIEGSPGYFSVSDSYFECQNCGTAVSKNNITMICIKCSNKYTTVQASYLNSVSYSLVKGVSVKPQSEPPKSIRGRMKEKYQPESAPEPVKETLDENPPEPEPIMEEASEPIQEPEPEEEPEPVEEAISEPEPVVESVPPVEPEIAIEPVVESDAEPEPKKKKRKKKKKSVLQNPMSRLSEMLKSKPKKKPTKKKSIKKIKKENIKPQPEPVEPEPKAPESIKQEPEPIAPEPIEAPDLITNEPEPVDTEPIHQEPEPIQMSEPVEEPELIEPIPENVPESIYQEPEPEIIFNVPEPVYEEPETVIEPTPAIAEEPIEPEYVPEETYTPVHEPEPEPEIIRFEEKPIPPRRVYEPPQTKMPPRPGSIQILMVVENVTVSEFVIESLEHVKKPINLLHIEDGALALKELKHKYDALILDYDLKSIESKFMISEMEKWGVMTPIIILSDEEPKLDKYILNIEAVLKKKQKSINKIGGILRKLF